MNEDKAVAEMLLACSPQNAVGVDLRSEPVENNVYYKVKDLRRDILRGERLTDASQAASLLTQWRTILTDTRLILKTQSKDLEIASWHVEALVRTGGYRGLASGLRVINGLLETYWETFHSLSDASDWSARLLPLEALNTEASLVRPLRQIPITEALDGHGYTYADYIMAIDLEKIDNLDVREARLKNGTVEFNIIQNAVKQTAKSFYKAIFEELASSIEEMKNLDGQLSSRGRSGSCRLAAVKDLVEDIERAIRSERPEFAHIDPDEDETTASKASDIINDCPEAETALHPPFKPIQSREQAIESLVGIADYFRKAEPHSPISASLEEIVRRAKLPFVDLLAELSPDVTAWRSILTTAGIKPPT